MDGVGADRIGNVLLLIVARVETYMDPNDPQFWNEVLNLLIQWFDDLLPNEWSRLVDELRKHHQKKKDDDKKEIKKTGGGKPILISVESHSLVFSKVKPLPIVEVSRTCRNDDVSSEITELFEKCSMHSKKLKLGEKSVPLINDMCKQLLRMWMAMAIKTAKERGSRRLTANIVHMAFQKHFAGNSLAKEAMMFAMEQVSKLPKHQR